eukprot:4705298-Alexandrium_andersonii.AAC.1
MQCGWTIDTAKAFENTAWALALFVLRHWQLDQKVLNAFEAAWRAQCAGPPTGRPVLAACAVGGPRPAAQSHRRGDRR